MLIGNNRELFCKLVQLIMEEGSFYSMDEFFERRSLYKLTNEAVQGLTKKEQKVIRLRFFEGRTLKEIGKELNNTQRENARRVEAMALRKLRCRLIEKLKTKEEREKAVESNRLECKELYFDEKRRSPEVQRQLDEEWQAKSDALWHDRFREISVSLYQRLRRTTPIKEKQ